MMTRFASGLTLAVAVLVSGEAFAQRPEGGPNRGPQGGPPWMRARIMFQVFDADRDGTLTADEAPANAWKYLSTADADEDGSVTQAEVAAFSAARLIGNFDENEDGELTADEAPGPVWDRLSAADADENGSVSAAEIANTILSAPRRGGPPSEGSPAGEKPADQK